MTAPAPSQNSDPTGPVSGPPSRTPRRRRRWFWPLLIVIGFVTAVAVGVAGGFAIVNTALAPPTIVEGEQPAAIQGAADAPATGHRAAYSFGRTANAVAIGTAGTEMTVTQRIPFEMTAEADSFRVVMRNWSFIADEAIPGSVDLKTVYLGEQADPTPGASSAFATTPTRLAEERTLVDGEEYATGWFSRDQLALDADGNYLLSMAFTADGGQRLGVSGNSSWLSFATPASDAGSTETLGEYSHGGSFLDVWIEYSYAADQPSIVVLGHSLSSGASTATGETGLEGETSSWHQQWAIEYDGVSSSLSVPGSWAANYPPDSPKWTTAPDLDPEYVVVWSASSDLIVGTMPDEVRVYWEAMLDSARTEWPGAKIVAVTEPPRQADGQGEQNRIDWNTWLRGDPEGVDLVLDADALVADPSDPSRMTAALQADGVHFSVEGHREIADAFQALLTAP